VIDLHDEKDKPQYDPDETPELIFVRLHKLPDYSAGQGQRKNNPRSDV
jgi:hypothetical protein